MILIKKPMPKCCDDCFALDDNGDYPHCQISGTSRGYNFNTRDGRMVDCPMREATEVTDTMTPFDVLDTLGAAWAGKQCFFEQEDGRIYDRFECDYIDFDTAVNRMSKRLWEDM